MAEKKYDLGGRKVELPGGGEFEFAWEVDTYPLPREDIEGDGLGKGALDGSVDDIIALAKMLEAWKGLNVSSLDTEIGILWSMHHRIDCLLHAFTATAVMKDTEDSGLSMAAKNIERIKRECYEHREFAVSDHDDADAKLGALAALLGALGGE